MATPTSRRLPDNRVPPTNNTNRSSGIGAVGLGFLTGDLSDDDDDCNDYPPPTYNRAAPAVSAPQRMPAQQQQQQLSRPTNGYLQAEIQLPNSQRVQGQRMPQVPHMQRPVQRPSPQPIQQRTFPPQGPSPAPPNPNAHPSRKAWMPNTRPPPHNTRPPHLAAAPQPRRVPPPIIAPSFPGPGMSPHPLEEPEMPITPIFAQPKTPSQRQSMIKFSEDTIMRGNSEETLLSRGTPKGAEFWRRFSVVVKDEQVPVGKRHRSSWLAKNQSRSSKMSVCVWIASLVVLLCIGAGVGFGWYFTHNAPSSNPQALGGSAGHVSGPATTSTSSSGSSSSSSPLVTVTGNLPPSNTPPPPVAVATPTTPSKRHSIDCLNLRHSMSHRIQLRRKSA